MAINLRLMADYECFPLWGLDIGQIGEVDPDLLPISLELKKRIVEWGHMYTSTLNRNDPPASRFESANAEGAFERDGLMLWRELRLELGPGYNVLYQSAVTGKELSPDDHPL